MNLSINGVLRAMIEIIWLSDEIFALQIIIEGPHQELQKIQPVIEKALLEKKNPCTNKKLTAFDPGRLEMTAFQCTHLQFINALTFLGYDIQEPWPLSASAGHQIIKDCAVLEEAIKLAFDFLPLGKKIVGPKGKLILSRNSVPKHHPDVAEVCVMGTEEKDNKIIMTAYWSPGATHYVFKSFWGALMEDWSDKW